MLAGDTQYWFGDALLIAGVYEEGRDIARIYLPRRGDDYGSSGDSSSGNEKDSGKNNHGHRDYGYVNTNAPYQ